MFKFFILFFILFTLKSFAEDSDLQKDFKKMLENNPEILSKKHEFEAQRNSYKQYRRNILPNVYADLRYGRQKSKLASNPEETYAEENYGVVLNQPIYTGGRLGAETERSLHEMNYSKGNLDKEINKQSLKLFNLYTSLYENYQKQKLFKKNISILKKTLKIVNVQIRLGEATNIDKIQVEARLTDALAELQVLYSEEKSLRDEYQMLVGKDIDNIPDNIDNHCIVSVEKDLDFKEAIQKNPDIDIAKSNLQISKQDYNLAKSEFMPNLSLVARASYYEGQSAFNRLEVKTSSALLQLRIPIFQSGIKDFRLGEAVSLEQAANSKMKSEFDRIEKQLKSDISYYKALKYSIAAKKKNVKATQAVFNKTKREQELGLKSVYELLEVERDLVEDKNDLYSQLAERSYVGCNILAAQGKFVEMSN